jgi:hypothetical protein
VFRRAVLLVCCTLVLELQKLLAALRPTSLPTAPVLQAHKLVVEADKPTS